MTPAATDRGLPRPRAAPVLTALPWLLAIALGLVGCLAGDAGPTLRVTAVGEGVVRVNGVPVTLPLQRSFAAGETVTLAAMPAEGHRFVGWSGDLEGITSPADVIMLADRRVAAAFEPRPQRHTLVVAFAGDGGGRVISDPPGIDCVGSCVATFDADVVITLAAEPDADAFLLAWGGCDAYDGATCTVTLTGDRAVGAGWALISTAPVNDAFADRTTISGGEGVVNASSFAATREAGEPDHGAVVGGRSLWWSWTAPVTGPATFDAGDSAIDAVVAVYTGDALAALAPAPPAAGTHAAGAASHTFLAEAGEDYHVAVDADGGVGGVLRLRWSVSNAVAWGIAPPVADVQATRGGPAPTPRTATLTQLGDAASAFTVASDRSWLHAAPSEGLLGPGEQTSLTLTVAACDEAGGDTGRLRVAGGGAEAELVVQRTCLGADWQPLPAELAFYGGIADELPPAARPVTLHNAGTAAAGFTVASDATWLSVAPNTGTVTAGGERELTVQVAACDAAGERTGALRVEGGGHTRTIPVTRACRDETPLALSIDRVRFNQAVPAADSGQPPPERLPLVAGRDALLRAFVTTEAPGATAAQASLVYRLPGGHEHTVTLAGPGEVPTHTEEGTLASTYLVQLAGEAVQPGLEAYLHVTAEDGGEPIDARFPASGWWRPEVVTVPPLPITLVPIALNGASPPSLNAVETYLDLTSRVFPLAPGATTAEVRAPLAFTGDLRRIEDWDRLLRELTRLRSQDGEAAHYLGLVNPPDPNGPAGIAWIGRPVAGGFVPVAAARSRLPAASWIVAHELGHNWGRLHAPCGDPPDPDPDYPYPGGLIGVWGYDLAKSELRSPTVSADLMSYCTQDAWISDYTFEGVLAFRDGVAAAAATAALAPRATTVLHVSGSITEDGVALDPVVALPGRPVRAPEGPYRLVGIAADGTEAFRVAFDALDVSAAGRVAFHVTVTLEVGVVLQSVRVARDGVALAERAAGPRPAAATAPTALRLPDGRLEIAWDARAWAEVVVLDGPAGAILGSDRSGTLRVHPSGDTVELRFTDGLNTSTALLRF